LLLLGCDFSSAPSRRKHIVIATGRPTAAGAVRLDRVHRFSSLDDWSAWLLAQPAWLGGFDLPFGLPRELVETLHWPRGWPELIAHYAALERADIRARFAAFCAARPVGSKFAHRATDGPAGSSPSMKWVNPPVAWMLHAGVPRLLAAGAHFPAHQRAPAARPARVALEAYPGLLARTLIGRVSYKSDDATRDDEARRRARERLLDALACVGSRPGPALVLAPGLRETMLAERSADTLDAAMCLVQAAWALRHADTTPGPGYGLPAHIDPLEGWIVGAQP